VVIFLKNSNKESIRIDLESVGWREVLSGEVKNPFNLTITYCLSYQGVDWFLIIA
jgi:hypothetical protein